MNDEWIPWAQGRLIANDPKGGNDGLRWAQVNKVPFMQAKKNGRVYVSRLACERLGQKQPPNLALKPASAPSTSATNHDEFRMPELSGLETAEKDLPNDYGETAWHPESYDINIKITVSHEMLRAIFLKGA